MEIRDVPHIWGPREKKKKKKAETSANLWMGRLLKIEPPHPFYYFIWEITAIMSQNHMTGG